MVENTIVQMEMTTANAPINWTMAVDNALLVDFSCKLINEPHLSHLQKWEFPVSPSGWMRDRLVGSLSAGNAWHPSRWERQAT